MSTSTDKKKDATATADPPAKAAIEAIEEDDEFEEFEPAHWAAGEEVSEDTQQWQDNWDADDMDDDFTKNLREELAKNSGNWGGGDGDSHLSRQICFWVLPYAPSFSGFTRVGFALDVSF